MFTELNVNLAEQQKSYFIFFYKDFERTFLP